MTRMALSARYRGPADTRQRQRHQTVLTGANLTKPGGIAIGPDGALYVTNNSISAGGGEVVRLTP